MEKRVHNRWPWVTALILLAATIVLLSVNWVRVRAEREESLFQAIERGDHAQVEALFQSGVRVDARRRSNPPSFWEPLLRLQTRWETPNYPLQIGYTPLMTASICGDVRTATFLLDRGADVQALESEHVGPTSLELAVRYRHPAVVLLLLDRGADPNGAPGSYGPLQEAWRGHDRAMMGLLLSRGARPLPAALKKPIIPIL